MQPCGIGARGDAQSKDRPGADAPVSSTEGAKPAVLVGALRPTVDAHSGFKRVLNRKASPTGGDATAYGEATALASATVAPSALVSPRDLEARTFAVSHPPPPSSIASVGRVLVGEGPRGSQARVEFRAGPLAGTALQLAAGRDGVHVQLVAAGEGARLALARVVDRVEARLRARGIVMNAATDQARAGGDRGGHERRGR